MAQINIANQTIASCQRILSKEDLRAVALVAVAGSLTNGQDACVLSGIVSEQDYVSMYLKFNELFAVTLKKFPKESQERIMNAIEILAIIR